MTDDYSSINSLVIPYAQTLAGLGVPRDTVGFQRLMATGIGLHQESPVLFERFLDQLPAAIQEGMTIESIAQASANSYQNPQTGQFEFNRDKYRSYQDLLGHERRVVAGSYDFGGKIPDA